jgi:hypothetical protein
MLQRRFKSVKPHHPVDIASPDVSRVESRAAGAVGLIPTAALVFGAIMWIAVLVLNPSLSETKLVQLSWFAMFPTVFGLVGRILRNRALAENKPAVAKPLGIALAWGFGAVLFEWFFYEAIWPSL